MLILHNDTVARICHSSLFSYRAESAGKSGASFLNLKLN
jgi:hypothetical protein